MITEQYKARRGKSLSSKRKYKSDTGNNINPE